MAGALHPNNEVVSCSCKVNNMVKELEMELY